MVVVEARFELPAALGGRVRRTHQVLHLELANVWTMLGVGVRSYKTILTFNIYYNTLVLIMARYDSYCNGGC